MAIYGRTGDVVTVIRRGVLADVQRLEGRKPDRQDREALKFGAYVVVKSFGKERLYHLAFLRADGGSREIDEAIEAADKKCPHCDRPKAVGGVTCTGSACQEAEYHANAARAKSARVRR